MWSFNTNDRGREREREKERGRESVEEGKRVAEGEGGESEES